MIDTLAVTSVACTCLLVAYSAVIYPALLSLAAKLLGRPWIRSDVRPRVSIIIPAHNEQGVIASKLDNILATNYPPEAFEVLVASDCSTDATDAIVRSFAPRVRLIRAPVRSGKQVCLNLAVAEATGEIIVFSDAAGLLAPNAMALLVRHFADPSVGAASSAIRVRKENSDGEGIYLGADCAVRVREGEISSIVGCVGACYAMRRECFTPFHPGDCDDFAAVFSVVASGKRAIMDPQVVCEMSPARNAQVELVRKVRTMAGALDTVWRYRGQILRSAPASLIWFVLSHKVCRWLIPVFVFWTGFVLTVAALLGHSFWQIAFAAGSCVAGAGVLAWRFGWENRRLAFLKPFAFVVVSMWAGVIAWWKACAGKKQVVWQPTRRVPDMQDRQAAAHSLQPLSLDYSAHPDLKAQSIALRDADESNGVLAVIDEKTC